MKVASMDNWPVLQKFYRKLAQDMHDIIIPVEKVTEVLHMLAQTHLEGHQCHLTLKYGAPLHERWGLNGGWSSHTYFGPTDKPMARVDIFGNPPRILRLEADQDPLFLSRDGVARMKKTRREKDFAFANLLGEQMLVRGDPAGLLHITDPKRLIDVAQKTVIGPSLNTERPLLKLALSGSPEVERYIKAEKDFWSTLDDMRLKAYAKAWIPYGAEIQSTPGLLHTELQEQNRALVKNSRADA